MSYTDRNIVRQLQRDDLGILSERQVAAIRKKMNMVRRMTVWDRRQADEQLEGLVRQELDSGAIEGYGRRLLEKWFRMKGYVTTRESLFAIVKRLDPEGLDRRTRDLNRRKGEYIVPGLDYLWLNLCRY